MINPYMYQVCMAFPILPGKESNLKDLAKTLRGAKSKEFDQSQKRSKTKKETWFLQSGSEGTFCLVYFESEMSPEKTFENFAKSKDTLDVWVKGQLKEISGIDIEAGPEGAMPQQILTYGY